MSDAEARKEAIVELGKGIALGLVPILGQAIDAYDTVESAIALYNVTKSETATEEERDTAKFDLVLAIVGWIPGPGDGVKKSLRIVNRNPDRFAPVLFDMLRFVLSECGIQTSPEALLEQVFDAGYLQAQLDNIVAGVKGSKAFGVLPKSAQSMVLAILQDAGATLPQMVGVVQRRIQRWKHKQPNSSAATAPQGHAAKPKPEKKDAAVAQKGKDAGAPGHAGDVVNARIKEQALSELTNEMVGISGEHIADYICADTFGWGKDWHGHDKGGEGTWSGKAPGKQSLGKLSRNGKLYKLADGPNGTGIDSVWRASAGNNGGKPYAIVEAKATKDEDAPKFARVPGHTRKPSIRSKLADNAPDPNPTAEELIEPRGAQQASGRKAKAGGGKGGSTAGAPGRQRGAAKKVQSRVDSGSTTGSTSKTGKAILVQMSPEWIEANIMAAIGLTLARDVMRKLAGDQKNYARHLFFAPYWHPSGSPASHMKAKMALDSGQPPKKHDKHDAYHYDDDAVKVAANARKRSLSAKWPSAKGLTPEK